ncbi:MAG: LysE family translocator, partial [Stellaceae bacterium]
MYLITFLKGLVVGIVIALPVGPVGVLCVRRTLFEGLSFGLVSGIGAALADMMFGVIAGFGLTFVRDAILAYQDWLGEAGGLFLVYAGVRSFRAAAPAEPEPLAGERMFGSFASAFA